MSSKVRTLTFVTGNANKLREVKALLSLPNLVSQKIDLPELQGEPMDIIKKKTEIAALEVKGPVLVEDTCLCFNALNGLPGPYIKWFLEKTKLTGLNNLLTSYEDKTAYAQCLFGLSMGPGTETMIFAGQCDGSIVPARGSTKFGWDAVFQPEGKDKTFGEMSTKEKSSISHRGRALDQLREYLEENPDIFHDYTQTEKFMLLHEANVNPSSNGRKKRKIVDSSE